MRGTASANAMEYKPERLMHRLAQVEDVEAEAPRGIRADREPSVATYFGVGLLSGAVAGAGLLLGVQVLGSDWYNALRAPVVPTAIAALSPWVTEPAKPPRAFARAPQPDAFDMTIDRSAGASAPLGLRLVGSQDSAMEILMRGVPAATRLSHGERRDASTWALKAADLRDLRLTLDERTPEAFAIGIEVVAPVGVAAASSVVRVRLVGSPAPAAPAPPQAEPVQPPTLTAVVANLDTPAQIHNAVSGRSDAVVRSRERVARASKPPPATTIVEIARRQPVPAAHPEERHWPEGASGLGAVARESDRQVWWKLPPPTWSPFLDAAGR